MNILFYGNTECAAKCIKWLLIRKHNVMGVMTRTPCVAEIAMHSNIPINPNPEKLDFDIILCVFYHKLIPIKYINRAKFAINFHGAKLPEYRGCLPTIWAIINGDKTTEITAHLLEKNFDTGDIIKVKEIPIEDDDTGEDLYEKIKWNVTDIFIDVVNLLEKNTILTTKQKDGGKYYSRKIPNDGFIDLNKSPKEIYNFIRALDHKEFEPAKLKLQNKIVYVRTTK